MAVSKPYDVSAKTQNGRIVVEKLVKKDGEKETVTEVPELKPYCYVRNEDFEPRSLRSFDVDFAAESPDGFVKLTADHPRTIQNLDESVPFDTYEADVNFHTRYMIDTQIGVELPSVEEILYFDIEVDPTDGFPDPERASDRILSIGAIGGDGKEFYFDDEDERELIIKFLQAADDYYILAGWNSIGFDFPYLKNRAPKVGIDPNWRRWVMVDMMPLYDSLAVPTKTVSLKLDDVGSDELNIGKTEGIGSDPSIIKDWWDDNDPRLRKYNIQDCRIVKEVDEKYELVKLLHELCDICNYPPGEACYEGRHGKVKLSVGMIADAKVLTTAHKRGQPLNNRGKHADTGEFPGGDVLDPKPGLYDNVVIVDYSGMYPNIIRAFNFGPSTWYQSEYKLKSEHPDAKVIQGENGVFVGHDTKKSILAEAVDELVDLRDRFKAAIDQAPADSEEKKTAERRDAGVKVINNTLYGIFASPYHRYYIPGGSENITLIGQHLVRRVEDIANRSDKIESVVYGDTDSVMILLRDTDDVVQTATEVADTIETELQRWANDERNARGDYLQLDVDDVFARFFISDKKKRYFGKVVWDGKPCDKFKVRGFEVRQGNWPTPVRQLQEDLMHAVIDGVPTQPIIKQAKKELFSGQWDSELATETTLTKPPKEYDASMPHVTAAEQIRDEFGKAAAQVDDKIGYIKYGNSKENVTYVLDGNIGRNFRPNEGYCPTCDDVKWSDHEHDIEDYPHLRREHYSFLWTQKFVSVMNSIEVEQHNQAKLTQYQ